MVPLGGQALFSCKPDSRESNVTYTVTWIHRHLVVNWSRVDRIVYENGRPIIEPDPTQEADKYNFISQEGKGFIFRIDNVTEASVGQVRCFIKPVASQSTSAATFYKDYFLYVELGREKMFPRPMDSVTVVRGEIALFKCHVYFRVEFENPCSRKSLRFRWCHQGKYVNVPKGDSKEVAADKPTNIWNPYLLPRNSSFLVVRKAREDQEGTVRCEVRWGPRPERWFRQEAYLTVI